MNQPNPRVPFFAKWRAQFSATSVLRRILLAMLVPLVLVAGLIVYLGRESTLQTLLPWLLHDAEAVQVRGIHGSLWGPLRIEQIRYRDAHTRLQLDQLALNWQPWQLLRGQIAIEQVQARYLEIESLASSPGTVPKDLRLPLNLVVQHLGVSELVLLDHGKRQNLAQWDGALRAGDGLWRVSLDGKGTPLGRVSVNGQMAQAAPFALQGQVTLRPAQTHVVAQLSGNLLHMQVQGKGQWLPPGPVAVANQALAFTLGLAPFAPFPLQDLSLSGSHLDPARWHAQAPHADLTLDVHATLQQGQWQGKLQLDNALAGSSDQQRLPLAHVSSRIGGNATVLQLDALQIDLGKGGQFQGKLTWDSGRANGLSLALQTANLDLQGLHARMRPTRIGGTIELRQIMTTVAGATVPSKGMASQAVDGSNPNAQSPGVQLHASLNQRPVLPLTMPISLDIDATINASQLQWQTLRLVAGRGGVQLAGQIGLQATWPFAAKGQLQHINPAEWGQFPSADLNGELSLQGALAPAWQLALQGRVRNSQFMQQALVGAIELKADQAHVSLLDLTLALGENRLAAHGSLGGSRDQLNWQVDWPDLVALGWSGSVAAHGSASGGLDALHTSVDLSTHGLRHALGGAGDNSVLQASGEVRVRPVPGLDLRVRAEHLNPARLGPYPVADLQAQATLRWQTPTLAQSALQLEIAPSTLQGLPLAGHASLERQGEQLQKLDLALDWGNNRAQVRQLAADATTLDFDVQAPTLLQSLRTLIAATPARNPGASHQATPALPAPQSKGDPPAARQAVLPALSAHGRWQGSLGGHTLRLHAQIGAQAGDVSLAGGWHGADGWQGQIQSWRGPGQLTLQAPVRLAWSPERFQLDDARFLFDGGTVFFDTLAWQGATWRAKGMLHGVPVSLLSMWQPGWPLAGGLRLGAEFDVRASDEVNGFVRLAREGGDWQPGPDWPKGLGLQKLMAGLLIRRNAVQADWALAGTQIGQAQGRLASTLSLRDGHWGLAGNSPLQLQATASIDSLAPLAGLANGQISCDGKLALQVDGTGTIGDPVLTGHLDGSGLGLRWINEGLNLKNGVLRAEWSGHQLQVRDWHFDGVALQGQLDLSNPAQPVVHLKINAEQFPALSRPDRVLVVSGQSAVDYGPAGVRLSGHLKAERANLELAAQDSPTLSDDIHLVHGHKVIEKPNPTLPLVVDLEFDLGEQFHIRGQGLDARLGGKLRWQALEKRGPRLVGEVQVFQGSYRLYGQKLSIDHGSINFSGAWDNPGLNILAKRERFDPDAEVDVGVELRGTLLAPQARLVSTPVVPDSEKLAWLVLGHGLEGSAGQELNVLGAASAALLGSTRDNVANRLGLDELGVSTAKGVENAVFTVGKRLSNKAYISFEQGLGGASGLVKLRYALNPRVSVQVQTGNNNAADVFYSWRFD